MCFDDRFGRILERRKLDTQVVGFVGDQFTKSTGLEDGGKTAGGGLAPGLQQHQDRRHLVEVVDFDHAVTLEQCLEHRVIAGDRAGMGQRHGRPQRRLADFQDHHRDIAGIGFRECRDEACRVTHGFEKQADHARIRLLETPVHVVGDGRGQFVTRRYAQVETQPATVVTQRGKSGPRLGDIADLALNDFRGTREDAGVEIVTEVIKTHAVETADLDAGRFCYRTKTLEQHRFGILLEYAAGVDGDRPGAMFDGRSQRGFEVLVAECDHDMLHRQRQRLQVRMAWSPEDFAGARIDQVHITRVVRLEHHLRQHLARAVGPVGDADQRDAGRLQQRIQVMLSHPGRAAPRARLARLSCLRCAGSG